MEPSVDSNWKEEDAGCSCFGAQVLEKGKAADPRVVPPCRSGRRRQCRGGPLPCRLVFISLILSDPKYWNSKLERDTAGGRQEGWDTEPCASLWIYRTLPPWALLSNTVNAPSGGMDPAAGIRTRSYQLLNIYIYVSLLPFLLQNRIQTCQTALFLTASLGL